MYTSTKGHSQGHSVTLNDVKTDRREGEADRARQDIKTKQT